MDQVMRIVAQAKETFRLRLEATELDGGLTLERYVRYLSMQYHLTNGVQRHFMQAAAHPDLAHRQGLRRFLFDFANEEELHYEIARRDLKALEREPLPACLDVKLWWAYFDAVITEQPFIRLGATCILENLSAGAGDVVKRLFAKAAYLTPRNTRFFVIHQHDETLPHGDQILAALSQAQLTEAHLTDLEAGAKAGFVMYMRMAEWALCTDPAQLVGQV